MSANPVLAPGVMPSSLWLNRRASVRHQSAKAVSGRVTGSKANIRSASLINISLGGVALRLDRRLRKGSKVLVRLDNPTLGLSYDLAARVAHSWQRPDGKWIVGFQFARTLSSEELSNLL